MAAAPSQDGGLIVAHASGTVEAVHEVRFIICQVNCLALALFRLYAQEFVSVSGKGRGTPVVVATCVQQEPSKLQLFLSVVIGCGIVLCNKAVVRKCFSLQVTLRVPTLIW